jgi:predicted transcriptional regulator
MSDETNSFTALTARIVGAFVGKHSVAHADLPKLIHTVHDALKQAVEPEAAAVAETVKLTAAQIRKSIKPDALISFIDGKSYRTLKRHLTTHGLTVEDYKAKFGLSKDYPTTAPSYSAARSAMAKALGLGRKAAAVEVTAPARRRRAKKAPADLPSP